MTRARLVCLVAGLGLMTAAAHAEAPSPNVSIYPVGHVYGGGDDVSTRVIFGCPAGHDVTLVLRVAQKSGKHAQGQETLPCSDKGRAQLMALARPGTGFETGPAAACVRATATDGSAPTEVCESIYLVPPESS